jgi:hypothetical protein
MHTEIENTVSPFKKKEKKKAGPENVVDAEIERESLYDIEQNILLINNRTDSN